MRQWALHWCRLFPKFAICLRLRWPRNQAFRSWAIFFAEGWHSCLQVAIECGLRFVDLVPKEESGLLCTSMQAKAGVGFRLSKEFELLFVSGLQFILPSRGWEDLHDYDERF